MARRAPIVESLDNTFIGKSARWTDQLDPKGFDATTLRFVSSSEVYLEKVGLYSVFLPAAATLPGHDLSSFAMI